MKRTIRWNRDFSGREVEALCGGEPLPPLPHAEKGELTCLTEEWSYKKGDRTLVEIQDGSDHPQRQYTFIDVANSRTISGVPRDAFEFAN